MIRAECSWCKKEIYRFPHEFKERNYCSRNCSRKKAKVVVVCITCSMVKHLLPCEARKQHGFCSIKCSKVGELNPNWKSSVGYEGIHSWVRRRLIKPEMCPKCNIRESYDLANISQKYLRDLSDWKWLCRRCHMVEDGRINNLKQYA